MSAFSSSASTPSLACGAVTGVIESNDIAYVSSAFVQRWQATAQRSLVAVTQTETSIVDAQQQFQFSGYIGSVFPMVERNTEKTIIFIPVKHKHNQAMIKTGIINTSASNKMPLTASPKNLVHIINPTFRTFVFFAKT